MASAVFEGWESDIGTVVAFLLDDHCPPASCSANDREFVKRHGGQLAVGQLQQDRVAEHPVVEVALKMKPVPAPLGANDGTAGPRRPAPPADRDHVFNFDPIARLQFIK